MGESWHRASIISKRRDRALPAAKCPQRPLSKPKFPG